MGVLWLSFTAKMNFLHPRGLAPLRLLKYPGAIKIAPSPTVAHLAKRCPQAQQRCAGLDVTCAVTVALLMT